MHSIPIVSIFLLLMTTQIAGAATTTNIIKASIIVMPENATVLVTNSSQLAPTAPSTGVSKQATWIDVPRYCIAGIAGNGATGMLLCVEHAMSFLGLLP
jgi:hypothetical protein